MNPQKRLEIFKRFKSQNAKPTTELRYATTFELLIAVILSAQATDVGVNKATAQLFTNANTPQAILKLGLEGANLNILTNEIATCKYGNSSSLLFYDMTKFENTDGTKHSANIGNSNYLNVKCSDRFNHVNSFDVFKGK